MLPKLNTYIIKQTCLRYICPNWYIHVDGVGYQSTYLELSLWNIILVTRKKVLVTTILKTHKQRKTTELKSLHTNYH